MTLESSLYRRVLAEAFESLPDAVKEVHSFAQEQRLEGRAEVQCNGTIPGKALLRLLRLPRPGRDLPAHVVFRRDSAGEVWQRRFGDDSFASHLSPHARQPGRIIERKDAVAAVIRLEPVAEGLRWHVESFRLLGLPLPRFLAPRIEAFERDVGGRYHFEMTITLPLLGHFIAYKGWLKPGNGVMRSPPAPLSQQTAAAK